MAASAVPIHYTAAGGVVTDSTRENVLLLIRPSRDEVRLPKGHQEPGEALAEAALREVQEETGLCDLEILVELGAQAVSFPLGMSPVTRTEHYFLMAARSLATTDRPTMDDDQFVTIWVPWEEALAHLTFEAERIWVQRAMRALERLV